MAKYNEQTYKANLKYRAENIKRVPLDLQKEEFERVRAFATERGESVNGFIKRAIRETMEREKPGRN